MKKIMLLCVALLGSSAYAASTPAEIEALVKSGKYKEAYAEIKEVVKEHPDSYKANYYAAQLASQQKDHVGISTYESKAAKIKSNEQKEYFMNFLAIILAIIAAIAAVFGAMWFMNQRAAKIEQDRILRELAEEKEATRQSLLTQALQAKSDIDDSILLLKAAKDNKALAEEMAQLKSIALDAIEILSEEGDYDEDDIRRFLSDAANGVRYVNRMYDK